MSQFVDYNWGKSKYHMQEIMENKVVIKVFRDKRILCVSPAYIEPMKVRLLRRSICSHYLY